MLEQTKKVVLSHLSHLIQLIKKIHPPILVLLVLVDENKLMWPLDWKIHVPLTILVGCMRCDAICMTQL